MAVPRGICGNPSADSPPISTSPLVGGSRGRDHAQDGGLAAAAGTQQAAIGAMRDGQAELPDAIVSPNRLVTSATSISPAADGAVEHCWVSRAPTPPALDGGDGGQGDDDHGEGHEVVTARPHRASAR